MLPVGVATFLVIRTQDGPEWDASRPMEEQTRWQEHADYMDELTASGFFLLGGPSAYPRVPFAVSAADRDEIEATLARDPWHESHLVVRSIEPWTIRLRSPLLGDRV